MSAPETPDGTWQWREAKRVQPGWHVRMEGEWHPVRMILSWGSGVLQIETEDGFTGRIDKHEEIATRNIREARAAA